MGQDRAKGEPLKPELKSAAIGLRQNLSETGRRIHGHLSQLKRLRERDNGWHAFGLCPYPKSDGIQGRRAGETMAFIIKGVE